MSRDNWERLVKAVLRNEELRELARAPSMDPSEVSSRFSFSSISISSDLNSRLSFSSPPHEHVPFSHPQVVNKSRAVPFTGSSFVDWIIPKRRLAKRKEKLLHQQLSGDYLASETVSEVSSLSGRAGTVSIGKVVDVLDTLGSRMTNLNLSGTKGSKILILAFEVANTIVEGANLMHSLSKENIRHLKEVVLPSEGVQSLISKEMDELQRFAAADKRAELKVFSGDVVRYGNLCINAQWHNLDRYFHKLEFEFIPHKQLKEEAETAIQQFMTLVQYTAELYHEARALDRFEQDYCRKAQEEDNLNTAQKGDSLAILRAELKKQKKHVKSLKKKSLWVRYLEEVMERLVVIVHFLNLEIHTAFGRSGDTEVCNICSKAIADGDKPVKNHHQKLGSAGLALHYATIITQMDTLVTRLSSVPPSTRDALYHGLPLGIKSALRSKLQSFQLKEELTVPQIKGKMEKTLQWLVPMATNTTKAHHRFGWVGEWANTWSELSQKPAGLPDLLRIETLHHADKEKTEAYILDLVVLLHHLISQSRAANVGFRSPVKSPIRPPNQKTIQLSTHKPSSPSSTALTVEDHEMLRDVSKRKLTPGISKSQEFDTVKTRLDVINFDIDRIKALDVIDGVDTI